MLCMDIAGMILAFQVAFWTRFYCPPFLSLFPVTKGIPDVALYHQALLPFFPMCLALFFHAGFYRQSMLSAYDELILVLRGVVQCALLAMAMSFMSYRGHEYSRLVVALWAAYSVVFIYIFRE